MGEAVTQMDQATQQNAALVEEMAAAASSLKCQAQELVQTVAVFKLGERDVMVSPPKAAVRSLARKVEPFKGQERRDIGIPKGAAARAPAHKAGSAATTLADKHSAPNANVSSNNSASNGGDEDWEMF